MKSVTFIGLNAKYCHTSLAIRSLGAAALRKGISVTLLERSINEPFHSLMDAVLRQTSDVYAFSCYLWNIQLVRQICMDLKKMKPDCEILLGGPEVSYDPDQYPFADVIICGEGEVSVPDYLLGKVAGRVIHGVPVTPLDDLPFCYSAEDLAANRHRLIYYESSRGCPYSCSYCLSSVEEGVRFMSVERVCRDLYTFDRAEVDLVKFVDRTFNAALRRADEIWRFAAFECHHTRFHFELSGDLLTDDQLALLATVPKHKFQFEIGIQSTNAKTLRAVDRQEDCTRLFDRITRLVKQGNIPVHTDLIVGMPWESYALFQASFNDVYALQSDCLQVGFLKLLKGSKIRREADRYQYRYSASAPYEIYDNAFLTYEQVARLEQIADTVDRFYNSGAFPKSVSYAVTCFASAFAFYEAFSKEFDGLGALAQKKLYEIFFCFMTKTVGEDKLFAEYLRFDWLFHTGGAPVPPYMEPRPSLQPLFFQLLERPEFCCGYLPEWEGRKAKDIVKHAFLADFYLPQRRYYLFSGDHYYDVTDSISEKE